MFTNYTKLIQLLCKADSKVLILLLFYGFLVAIQSNLDFATKRIKFAQRLLKTVIKNKVSFSIQKNHGKN